MFHHSRRARAGTAAAWRRGAGELFTLVKFGLVGGSGYIVNLAVFALVAHLGGHHILAATVAFLIAVVNNFHWNRRWTFKAVGKEAMHRQAQRFMAVSAANYFLQLGLLELLINAGLSAIGAQAISVIVVMPLGFVGNRMWTFHEEGGLRDRLARRRRQRRLAELAEAAQD